MAMNILSPTTDSETWVPGLSLGIQWSVYDAARSFLVLVVFHVPASPRLSPYLGQFISAWNPHSHSPEVYK